MEKLWKPVNPKGICLIKLSTNIWLSSGGLKDSWGGGRGDTGEKRQHNQHSKPKGKDHEMLNKRHISRMEAQPNFRESAGPLQFLWEPQG